MKSWCCGNRKTLFLWGALAEGMLSLLTEQAVRMDYMGGPVSQHSKIVVWLGNSEWLLCWKHMCIHTTELNCTMLMNNEPCKNSATKPCQLTKLQLKMLIWPKTSIEGKQHLWERLGFKWEEGKDPSPPAQAMEHQRSDLNWSMGCERYLWKGDSPNPRREVHVR